MAVMNIPSAASLAVLAVDGKDRREELVLGGHDFSLASVTLHPKQLITFLDRAIFNRP